MQKGVAAGSELRASGPCLQKELLFLAWSRQQPAKSACLSRRRGVRSMNSTSHGCSGLVQTHSATCLIGRVAAES